MSLLTWDYGIQWSCPSQAEHLTPQVKGGSAGIMLLTWPGEVGVSGNMKDQGSSLATGHSHRVDVRRNSPIA